MNKGFRSINFPATYKYSSDSEHIPLEFYEDVFPVAKKIDLLLGYFSSNAFKILSQSFAEFIYNGGEMRIITNHVFSLKDKEHLLDYSLIDNENKIIDIFGDLELLEKELSDYGKHFFDCLKYLQKKGKLKIQPVKFNGVDLAHCKKMILFDGQDYISTDGSINFTLSALIKNSESFEVNAPWKGEIFNKRTILEKENFDNIFNKNHLDYQYLEPSDIECVIDKIGKEKDIQDLLNDSVKLPNNEFGEKVKTLRKRKEERFKLLLKEIRDKEAQHQAFLKEPHFPMFDGKICEPRDYQVDAYNAWVKNNLKGVFAMATGTGKTITSLNCLLNIYKENKSYKAIILVPTIALVKQWKKECLNFNFKNIITVSSKEKWCDNLAFFNTANKLMDASFIVIVTYASFTRPKFKSHFENLSADTLLIADEVHNMGAPNVSKMLNKIHLTKRIGLSATPDRKYDDLGNLSIQEFFNDKPPFVYSYSMKQALDIGWLCKYTYYPHIVYLTSDELKEYIKISKQLLKYLDFKTGKYKDCQDVEMLLLKRKRIIHKAFNKSSKFKEILEFEFKKKKGLKYTLIYVPEGAEPDYSRVDEYVENEEDNKLINLYTRIVSDIDDMVMVKQFTAGSKKRENILHDFSEGKIHVLTSMKCLDEGVDVPRSELAVFCASTGNPRQFIQRRGRVLRLHKDKIHATIHDLVVVPQISGNEKTFEMERNLLKKELERVVDFSELSMNKVDTYNALEKVLDYYNLNLNDLVEN